MRGYHVYKDIWGAAVGEELDCTQERGNLRDAYAIAVVRNGRTVGHLPRKLCRLCGLFIRRGGSISCSVSGRRRYSSDLPQGGLEIPCVLVFKGESKEINKLIKLYSTIVNVKSDKL